MKIFLHNVIIGHEKHRKNKKTKNKFLDVYNFLNQKEYLLWLEKNEKPFQQENCVGSGYHGITHRSLSYAGIRGRERI